MAKRPFRAKAVRLFRKTESRKPAGRAGEIFRGGPEGHLASLPGIPIPESRHGYAAPARILDLMQLFEPVLRAQLIGTIRPDGQEVMQHIHSLHVQPELTLGTTSQHGGRELSSARRVVAEAAAELG